ncbi:MAG TPA: aconitate hydratase AcnA [Myxococcales bacterium]|nr:aconitate hydratase AcnA [Myxococcales bacterium]
MTAISSFGAKETLDVNGRSYTYYRLNALLEQGHSQINRLPFSMRVLLENLLRNEDGTSVTREDIEAIADWDPSNHPNQEIAFRVARVILQDFTGVPAVVDLAAMRDAVAKLGGDPAVINPLIPADLVIDHSVQVDHFASRDAIDLNTRLEFDRNHERYLMLRWGQSSYKNFRVVPPGTGIVHQVNLEYLGQTVFTQETADGETMAYPDTLVGTDSHTTMINGLGIVGWGVGGIEAEAAMLGQPIAMLIPEVVGFKLSGSLPEGATATDLVLRVVEMLRAQGVVGKFVEFYGPGLNNLSLPNRATIANMAPEYGATMGFFPVDDETLNYLRFTGRSEEQVALVEAYCKAQNMFRTADTPDPVFSATLGLDLSTVVPCLAGPKRPQDRIRLDQSKASFDNAIMDLLAQSGQGARNEDGSPNAQMCDELGTQISVNDNGDNYSLHHGSVVIAAITSCTNTSNPSVLIAAGLLAQKAVAKGLNTRPWVKTSLAPGSKVVMRYLEKANLLSSLEALKFHLVGFGCTTCIGNSGPLPAPVKAAIDEGNLVACSVLSGNRNFEGRIGPDIRANYLASPPLVVAYAIAGRMDIDLMTQPLGTGSNGEEVFLRDIWPSNQEVTESLRTAVQSDMFRSEYASAFEGSSEWQALPVPEGDIYAWEADSTYIRNPPFFDNMPKVPSAPQNISGARCIAKLGNSVTTDHISPAGAIGIDCPTGKYLLERGVEKSQFNSYGSRRGNHEVMMRGTFANIRLRNQLAPGTEGGWTTYLPTGDTMTIFDAAMKYIASDTPLVVFAGTEYGTGSSRDWAAKETLLLGIKAVIATSFERIHRSNLIGMGVLPLQFKPGVTHESLGLTGYETIDITGISDGLSAGGELTVSATPLAGGQALTFSVDCRLDTPAEVDYYVHGGILQYVLRNLAG